MIDYYGFVKEYGYVVRLRIDGNLALRMQKFDHYEKIVEEFFPNEPKLAMHNGYRSITTIFKNENDAAMFMLHVPGTSI